MLSRDLTRTPEILQKKLLPSIVEKNWEKNKLFCIRAEFTTTNFVLFDFWTKFNVYKKNVSKTSQVHAVVMSSLPLEWLSFSPKQKWECVRACKCVCVNVCAWTCACMCVRACMCLVKCQTSMCKSSATRWP